MMICTNCLTEIDEKTNFCPNCGLKVKAAEPFTDNTEDKADPEPPLIHPSKPGNDLFRRNYGKTLQRVYQIIFNPKSEWPVIAEEMPDRRQLVKQYILPLSLVPFLASLVSLGLFSGDYSFAYVLIKSVIAFVLPVIVIYTASLLMDKMAPSFQSDADFNRSFQMICYAFTPVWAFSVFILIPMIYWFIHLAAFAYIIYQLIIALPLLRRIPRENATGVSIILVITMFVMYLVFGQIITRIVL